MQSGTEALQSPATIVLHLGSPTKLSAEEVAKAVAHHNRHHHGDQPSRPPPKMAGRQKKIDGSQARCIARERRAPAGRTLEKCARYGYYAPASLCNWPR